MSLTQKRENGKNQKTNLFWENLNERENMNEKILISIVSVCIVLSILSLVLTLSNTNGTTIINGNDSATERADSFNIYLLDFGGENRISNVVNETQFNNEYASVPRIELTREAFLSEYNTGADIWRMENTFMFLQYDTIGKNYTLYFYTP